MKNSITLNKWRNGPEASHRCRRICLRPRQSLVASGGNISFNKYTTIARCSVIMEPIIRKQLMYGCAFVCSHRKLHLINLQPASPGSFAHIYMPWLNLIFMFVSRTFTVLRPVTNDTSNPMYRLGRTIGAQTSSIEAEWKTLKNSFRFGCHTNNSSNLDSEGEMGRRKPTKPHPHRPGRSLAIIVPSLVRWR